jgi:fructose-1,6-bisphosphatase/inositol monophosphatase family enzyme
MHASLSSDLRSTLIRTAHALADAARPETLRHFRTGIASDDKGAGGRFDPVTEADRAAERAMRAVLARTGPQDAILGEEYGPTPARAA